jgi:outer membrane autotransporter protein
LTNRNLNAGSYTGSNNSTLAVAGGSVTGAATVGANASLTVGGTLTVAGAVTNSGSISTNKLTATSSYTGSNGSTLNLNGGSATVGGALTVNSGGKILLGANGSLTAGGGGVLAGDGALAGGGTLTVNGANQLLAISGSNNVALEVSIDATDTLELQHIAALGTTGAITDSGTLRLNGVSGTLAHSLSGAGNIDLVGAANVTLSGSGNLGGVINISTDSKLTANNAGNIGTAAIANSGTFVADNGVAWTFTNVLTGSGALVKQNGGNLQINQASARTGVTTVSGGTLTLGHLGGIGTGSVANNAALELSGTGGFANNISGTGVTAVSGNGVTISGSNTLFTGTWNITGSGTVGAPENLGETAGIALGGHLTVDTAGDFSLANELTGGGTLTVNLSGTADALGFAASSGTAFAGTVELVDASLSLDDANTAALGNANLRLGDGSLVAVVSDSAAPSRDIGGLELDGGTLRFDTYDPLATRAATIASVGDLALNGGAVVVTVPDPALIPSGTAFDRVPLLRQDDGAVLTQLIAASGAVTGDAQNIELLDHNGAVVSDGYTLNLSRDGLTTDAIGTYDFIASGGDDHDGLYVAFGLKEVNILAGRTLILDQDDGTEAGSDFGAAITGAGHLQISASRAITISGTGNSYTGDTTVTTGTLVLGADNALGGEAGHTAALVVQLGAAVDIADKTQTIGSLQTEAGSQINLDGGALTLTVDSAHYGEFTGSGLLVIDPSTLTVNSISANFSGTVQVTGGSTLLFNGAATVDGGAVQGVGSAVIQLDDTADRVVFSNVSGTVRNQTRGAGGAQMADGSVITLEQSGWAHTGDTVIDAGSALVTGAENALSPNSAHEVSGLLDLQGFRQNIASLRNHGTVRLAGDNGFNRLTVGDLSGEGVFVLGVDYTTGEHDTLAVTDSSAGRHGLLILGQGRGPRPEGTFELVQTPDGAATFGLVDPDGRDIATVSDGKFEYSLRLGNGSAAMPEGTNWYLSNVGLGGGGEAVVGTAGALGIGWFSQADNLAKRMGELRSTAGLRADRDLLDNIWVRGYGQQVNVGTGVTGRGYRQYLYGTDLGIDKGWRLGETHALYTGAFGGFGRMDQEFRKDSSSGKSETLYGGLYATWLHERGWFADLVAKAGHYRNHFESHDFTYVTGGDYGQWGAGASLELGRQIPLGDGWFATPLAQASYLRLLGVGYDTRDQIMSVDITAADIIQLRGGIQLGRTLKLAAPAAFLQPYLKAAAVQQISAGGRVTIDRDHWRPNTDGARAEFGAGIIWQLDANNQLHLDYEAALGDAYDQPWGLNAGYRHQF